MHQKINLSINKPCSEKFDQFKSTGKGGFCNSCQKEVIDFTRMSDREILEFFKSQKQNTCGRFHESQLKSYSAPTSPKGWRHFNLLGASLMSFSLFSLLPIGHTQAQQNKETTSVHVKQITTKKGKATTNKEDYVIKGVVTDNEDGSPLIGVNVIIKGTTQGTVTDIDGKFTLHLKAGDILVFSFIGFNNQEFAITDKAQVSLDIKMQLDDASWLGEVAVNKQYKSKRSLWQRFKAIFK